jgi:protein-tyrosine phosphatase
LDAVLFVCTGNLCRSPMAQVLLERELRLRDVEATVHSAGLRPNGRPAPEPAVLAMRAHGLDLSRHTSTGLDPRALRSATVVLGMDRGHIREIVAADPGAWPHTFTLKEFVRRAEAVGPRDAAWVDWLAQLHDGRTADDALGSSDQDDVADPYGLGDEYFVAAADEIAEFVTAFADVAWPNR